MPKEFTRREAMKTAMQGAAYAAPVVLTAAVPAGVAAATPPPPFTVSLFAGGTGARTKPDSITSDGQNIYVGYQNTTAADGSDGGSSTIVMYASTGQEVRSFSVQGRNDGLRFNPTTGLLWATVNEDANSSLYTINPTTGAMTHYTFSAAPHGGGYDDLAFTNGMAFVAASNPTNLTGGVNTNPAVAKVVLNGTMATLTPVLLGNATVTDVKTNQPVALNLLDPDSLSLDLAGNLVLVDQAEMQIIIIQNAGGPTQSATVLTATMPLDDTAWATTTTGRLFVVDAVQNTISIIRSTGGFTVGTVYTEVAPDTGTGLVGTIDLRTGAVTQIVTGFVKPTGLLFVP